MSAIQVLTEKASKLSLIGSHREPLKSAGSLDKFEKFDVTTAIGTEFKDVQLSSLLQHSDSDALIRDLAILVSERGVAFFRSQDISVDQQKKLAQKLGELSGKPKTSDLHVHPLTEETSELGDEISVIRSDRRAELYKGDRSLLASTGWHTDITFEPVPSDFAILKIHTLPPTGGDTLWASAYEVYDKLSPSFRKFLEPLQAYHESKVFAKAADGYGNKTQGRYPRYAVLSWVTTEVLLSEESPGAPENFGPDLEAIHPVVRTNPVTGWKGIFVNPAFTRRIIGLTKDESDDVLHYLFKLISQNHDLQVRFKWNQNDVAIWSNRSTFHTATWDYQDKRVGDRVVSLGERPYFDPESKSRKEALGLSL